jgi:hypothetical protein
MPCRKVKMKCHKMAQDTQCVRCARKLLQCDFLRHRRGRKHGFKLVKSVLLHGHVTKRCRRRLKQQSSRGQGNVASISSSVESVPISPETSRPLSRHADHDVIVSGDADLVTGTHGAQRSTSGLLSRPKSAQRLGQDFWAENSSFQPSDVLNRQITRGNFSLQNVLSTEHGDASEECTYKILDDDPINRGVINLHFATELFDGFVKHLNPFISQLDPSLHTFQYVRETSSFLFAAILAATAKLLHPALRKPLLLHAEELFLESFRCGLKSPETIQAILIMTYWKEPRDNRAWLSVGYAIRMAIELGWHQLGSEEMRPSENMSGHQAMQFRNVERTWLLLFVYDRR